MGIYGILWVFKLGVNTYNLWFKWANFNNLIHRLLMVKIKKSTEGEESLGCGYGFKSR